MPGDLFFGNATGFPEIFCNLSQGWDLKSSEDTLMTLRQVLPRLFGFSFMTVTLLAQQTATFNYIGPPLPVLPSSDADIFTIANIFVPTALQISKVTARVQISYPQVGDLNVYLFSPVGTRTKLLERNCGSLQNVDTTFDDTASTRFADSCPATAGQGPFRGNEPLGNFNNQSSFGTWRLAVQNNGGNTNTGFILNLSLTITGTTQIVPTFAADTITNEASLVSGPIAPGERVTIYGFALGPIGGTTAPAGNLPTTLGGTAVTMNGAAVPIAYSSATRVVIQVPSTLNVATATLSISYNGQTSANITVNGRSASPAIYTVAPGDPRAKATNQDGSLNSTQRPAPKVSSIFLYVSGLGPVSPSVSDGTVTPNSPLSSVSGPVTAYIGGVPATVSFAGLAPGLVGFYQVNLLVPANAPSGTQPILLVASNGATSQDQVFVQIQ